MRTDSITVPSITVCCGPGSVIVPDVVDEVGGGGTVAASRTVARAPSSRGSPAVSGDAGDAGGADIGAGTNPGYGQGVLIVGVGGVAADAVLDPRRVKAMLSANRLCSSRRR